MMYLLLVFVLFNFCITINSKACPTRSSIEKLLLDSHIPGAAIVVVNNTDILYQEAFGHQSFLPTQLMNVDESIFTLASISKTFIAVAIMQLVESNRLDLDTDINKYLLSSDPYISHPLYPSKSITLRQLASHSASIGQNKDIEPTFFQADDKALTETTLAEAVFSYLTNNASNWLSKPPGTVALYSNVGSALAALVVERVAKISFDEYVRQKILKPLGIDIKKAGFRLSNIENRENLVKHYSFNASYLHEWSTMTPRLNVTKMDIPNWLSIPFFSVSIYPAGLLRLSAKSLSIYLRMIMNNGSSLLRPESIIQMRTINNGTVNYDSQNSTNSELPGFGVFWYWETLDSGRRLFGHAGTMPGVTNSMSMNDKGDTGVIILTNADLSSAGDLLMKIVSTLNNIRGALYDCFEKQ